MLPIQKYGIILRLVEESDADFILMLRTDPVLSKYISNTSDNLTDQIKWIKNYKNKELANREFYYVAEDLNGQRYGTIRLYNFDDKSFEIGSWIFLPNSPLGMAIKAQFIGFEIGFNHFKAKYCRLVVRKLNISVLAYIKDFKVTMVYDDELDYYFILTKENFLIRRKNLSYLLNIEK